MKKLSVKNKTILMRFVKGILAGVFASLSVMTATQPAVWSDFTKMLSGVGVSIVYGAITGLLLALQKWSNWSDESSPDDTSGT